MKWIQLILGNRSFIWLLLIINTLGTIYGYYWYRFQLAETPSIFIIFVPDSPTASLFFMFVLIAFLLRKNTPLFEALALLTLFKYGIWAVVMNLLVFAKTGQLEVDSMMLIVSHGAMAVQGLLYLPYYRIKWQHAAIAAIWTLHNDVIDYVFNMMPSYSILNQSMDQIGYFTFWLSIVSIGICFYAAKRKTTLSIL